MKDCTLQFVFIDQRMLIDFETKSHIRRSEVSLTSFKYCSFVCYAFDMTLPQDVAKFLCCMS